MTSDKKIFNCIDCPSRGTTEWDVLGDCELAEIDKNTYEPPERQAQK
ncbi:MAG: hypothetical protein [Olavius algarvensis Gamma 3 endosymbiont]|nr:MAG: hypothetical protein [Olavius algarvensis Gamma 3 endosymbiont]